MVDRIPADQGFMVDTIQSFGWRDCTGFVGRVSGGRAQHGDTAVWAVARLFIFQFAEIEGVAQGFDHGFEFRVHGGGYGGCLAGGLFGFFCEIDILEGV